MNVNSADNVNFTSLIPTRVFINGLPATDEKFIRQACNSATTLLAGPVKEHPQFRNFIIKLGELDPDFKPVASWNGYKCLYDRKHKTKSDFFRIIFDENKRAYITTGKESELLLANGRDIGNQKGICNEYNISNSFEHQNAILSYKNILNTMFKNINKLKIKYLQHNTDGSTIAKSVSMDIYVTAKQAKCKGQAVLKDMKLENLKLTLE